MKFHQTFIKFCPYQVKIFLIGKQKIFFLYHIKFFMDKTSKNIFTSDQTPEYNNSTLVLLVAATIFISNFLPFSPNFVTFGSWHKMFLCKNNYSLIYNLMQMRFQKVDMSYLKTLFEVRNKAQKNVGEATTFYRTFIEVLQLVINFYKQKYFL